MPRLIAVFIAVLIIQAVLHHFALLAELVGLLVLGFAVFQATDRGGRPRSSKHPRQGASAKPERGFFSGGRLAYAIPFGTSRSQRIGQDGEQRVHAILQATGYPVLTDIILSDGAGLTQVDHLVRLPWGIAVIETKTYAGFVTGSKQVGVWRQSLGYGPARQTRNFQSPVHQNYRHVCAVRDITGLERQVVPLVVMAGRARLSDWVASQVVRPDQIDVELRATQSISPPVAPGFLDLAWAMLVENAAANAGRRQEHLDSLNEWA